MGIKGIDLDLLNVFVQDDNIININFARINNRLINCPLEEGQYLLPQVPLGKGHEPEKGQVDLRPLFFKHLSGVSHLLGKIYRLLQENIHFVLRL